MTDYKKKYEEEKAKRLEAENKIHQLQMDWYHEVEGERFRKEIIDINKYYSIAKPIKGLTKIQVEKLCELLLNEGYLDENNYFSYMFEPFFPAKKEHLGSFQFKTNWYGIQADLLYMLSELGLKSKRHFHTLAIFLLINSKITTNTKLASHSRNEPVGKKIKDLIDKYKKIMRVS